MATIRTVQTTVIVKSENSPLHHGLTTNQARVLRDTTGLHHDLGAPDCTVFLVYVLEIRTDAVSLIDS